MTAADLARARVPARYAQCDESRIKHQAELEEWALSVALEDHEGVGLYLCGPKGTGKSRALGWLTERIIFHGKANCRSGYIDTINGEFVPSLDDRVLPLFVRADDLVQSMFGDRELLERASGCDVLLLDDLGAAYEREYMTAGLASLIERRYSDMRPMAVTTNWPGRELAQRPGWERAADRLTEMCRVLVFGGESMREAPTNNTR